MTWNLIRFRTRRFFSSDKQVRQILFTKKVFANWLSKMEKGTKLKLKRKLKDPQQNITEEINRDGTGSNARSNAHVDVEEFVVLTSESDGEEPQEKQKKTLQGIESEPEQSDRSKRYLLHYSSVNLLPHL